MSKILPDVHTGLYSDNAWKCINRAYKSMSKTLSYNESKTSLEQFMSNVHVHREADNEAVFTMPKCPGYWKFTSSVYDGNEKFVRYDSLDFFKKIQSDSSEFLKLFAKFITKYYDVYTDGWIIKQMFTKKPLKGPSKADLKRRADKLVGAPLNPIVIEAKEAIKTELSKLRKKMTEEVHTLVAKYENEVCKFAAATRLKRDKEISEVKAKYREEAAAMKKISSLKAIA